MKLYLCSVLTFKNLLNGTISDTVTLSQSWTISTENGQSAYIFAWYCTVYKVKSVFLSQPHISTMYFQNHWNIPLVQSLGVEGGQHNTVSFPLHGKDAGNLKVDNGYGVGGYYQQNDHVGVNYKSGDVKHTFGVSSPFVGAGFQTGQAVAFPGLDVWERALG